MSSQLWALPKPGRARVLLREDYGGERQARVSAWQGLSCWRPGRQGCWSPSAALPQQWGSALHICLVWALCSCGLTVSGIWVSMFDVCYWWTGSECSCPKLKGRIPPELTWQQRPSGVEGRLSRSTVGQRECVYDLLGQSWLVGRDKTYGWPREWRGRGWQTNKPARQINLPRGCSL